MTEGTNVEQEIQLDAGSRGDVINTLQNHMEYEYAGFWMRFWAYLLDLVVIASIERLIIKPVFRVADLSFDSSMFSPFTIASVLIFYLYFILMTKYFHATIGKMVFGLRVISLKEESRLSWLTIIFREGIGRYISVLIKLLYLLVAFTPKKQALHDIFADTSVIYERVRKQFQPA